MPTAPVATTTDSGSAGASPAPRERGWAVYMVAASDGSLYTGVSTDVMRRLREHAGSRRGAKYFNGGRRPLAVVFCEQGHDRGSAARREAAIKKLSRAQKEALIAVAPP